MIFYLLNSKFEKISVIDNYESAIWTDRYLEPGDFELYIPINKTIPSSISIGKYLITSDSEHTMIIESIKIETDLEDSNKLIVTGRSLESLLDRRIIWNKTAFKSGTKLQTAVKKLITDNIINPSVSARQISNFTFSTSTDSNITSLELEAEYNDGDNLLDVINDICETNKIGYKVILNLNTKNFVFSLYAGKDRTYNSQTANSYVEFSTRFENLFNTDYSDDIKPHKNVTLVEGPEEDVYEKVEPRGDENPKEEGWYKYHDGEWIKTEDEVVTGSTYYKKIENEKKRERQVVGSGSGLSRREIFTDASSVQRKETITNSDGTTDEIYLTEAEFTANLIQKGKEKLAESKREEKFEGEVDYSGTFKYGKHYKIGDIVQIMNEYGFTGKSRVTEYIFSDDTNGLKCYPKFEMIDEEG